MKSSRFFVLITGPCLVFLAVETQAATVWNVSL